PNATVRGATVIGENATIGDSVEVKNSVISRGSAIDHRSSVRDSVLGRNVEFRDETSVANCREDEADVSFTVKGERVSTGRREFGVVAGDGAETEAGANLPPGLKLTAGETAQSSEVVKRDQ
ncbi:glucose-1-phosphate thymidylyltransferase, partial [Natronolimnohabitans sp. A-GB9]|nr:glucose-1-phosphate thymidylyltransferase [Natronolimnohabitans sp. A-GB9]